MTGQLSVIEGRVVHKKSNALQMSFQDGPGEPFAVGVQGGGDGKGAKLGVLFGFKNGGSGNHSLKLTDGTELNVASKDSAPSVVTRPDGVEIATVHRGDTSVARTSGGSTVVTFVGDPDEAKTVDAWRMLLTDANGEQFGRLDVIRSARGWTLLGAIDAVDDLLIWWNRAGQPMKVPIHGTRLTLTRPPTTIERDVLLAACVDIAIGLRPYITEMN